MARRASAHWRRVVPAVVVFLFVYLYVVVGYGYYGTYSMTNAVRHVLFSDGVRSWSGVGVLFLHVLFAYCVALQWRLSTAVPMYVDAISYHKQSLKLSDRPWLTLLLLHPIPLYTARFRDDDTTSVRYIAHATNERGEPERCWRDQCRGHWKAPRMRHCGACGECRFFFDHHCYWVRAIFLTPV